MRHYQGCPKRLFFGARDTALCRMGFACGGKLSCGIFKREPHSKVLRILLAAAAIGLASVSFIILTICTKRITMRNNANKSKRMVRIICIILAALFMLSLIIVPLMYVSAERQIKMGNVNSKEQEIGFSTEFFPSETGECNIAVHTWRPAAGQSVRGVIQLVHGMSEYVRRFQPIAEYFVSLGYVFAGMTMQGTAIQFNRRIKRAFLQPKTDGMRLLMML